MYFRAKAKARDNDTPLNRMARLALQAINHQRFPTNDQAQYTNADSTEMRSGHGLPHISLIFASSEESVGH